MLGLAPKGDLCGQRGERGLNRNFAGGYGGDNSGLFLFK